MALSMIFHWLRWCRDWVLYLRNGRLIDIEQIVKNNHSQQFAGKPADCFIVHDVFIGNCGCLRFVIVVEKGNQM